MLWSFNPREFRCLAQCERPTLLPRALSPSLSAASRIARVRSSIRATETQRTTSRARSRNRFLAIAGSLLAEISLTKLVLAWIVSIVLPAAILGLAPLIVTAWVGGVFSEFWNCTDIGAALLLLAIVARRLVRLASIVSRRGGEFLGAQRAWRSARIRLVPRGDPASRGAIPQAARRSGAGAHAGDEAARPPEFSWPSSRRWSPPLFGRTRAGSDRPPISPSRII